MSAIVAGEDAADGLFQSRHTRGIKDCRAESDEEDEERNNARPTSPSGMLLLLVSC
ncbi:hypothetical protein J3458_019981 [Metarhizium acridum]|uniref:uncharacterized protein n=1 Tax=Metarhizium acridum TaxID=92637 RepID=UPI001C6CBD82|nr:hypothetical protein J3458_019981 [Metarhizium acridum]